MKGMLYVLQASGPENKMTGLDSPVLLAENSNRDIRYDADRRRNY
jgi:hypothetical protein